MARVSEIAAQETQNVLNEFQNFIVNIITAEEMERILAAFKGSGDDFYKLESFGIFLQDYVISGGVITEATTTSINISEMFLSHMDFLWKAESDTITISTTDGTYIIYFSPEIGRFQSGTELPLNGFEIGRVTIANNIIDTIEDTRGEIGGIRFQPSIVIDGGEWE